MDRQIIAIGRTRGVDAIYSDDRGVKLIGQDLGMKVVSVSVLPLRPEKPLPPLLQAIQEPEPPPIRAIHLGKGFPSS